MPYGENPLFYKSMLISAGFRTTSHINILWAIVQFLKEAIDLFLPFAHPFLHLPPAYALFYRTF